MLNNYNTTTYTDNNSKMLVKVSKKKNKCNIFLEYIAKFVYILVFYILAGWLFKWLWNKGEYVDWDIFNLKQIMGSILIAFIIFGIIKGFSYFKLCSEYSSYYSNEKKHNKFYIWTCYAILYFIIMYFTIELTIFIYNK